MALPVVLAVRPARPALRQPQPFDAFALRPRAKYDSTNRELLVLGASVSRTLELAVPVAIGCPRGPPGEDSDMYVAETPPSRRRGPSRRPSTRGVSPTSPSTEPTPGRRRRDGPRRPEQGPPRYTGESTPQPRSRASTAASSAASPGTPTTSGSGLPRSGPSARSASIEPLHVGVHATLRVLAVHRPVPQRRRHRRLWYGRRRRRRLRPMDV